MEVTRQGVVNRTGEGGVRIGKEAYLQYLMDTYQNLIFSICYKMTGNYFDAEDLTQDTFLAAYKSLDTFDGSYQLLQQQSAQTLLCCGR